MKYESIQNMIYKLAHNYSKGNREHFENLVSVGNVEYVRILHEDLFKPEYGVKFSTFFMRYLTTAFHVFLRKECAKREFPTSDDSHFFMSKPVEVNPHVLDAQEKLARLHPDTREKLMEMAERGKITKNTMYRAKIGMGFEQLQQMFADCR